jgi:M6 family metalloprotease-like protein
MTFDLRTGRRFSWLSVVALALLAHGADERRDAREVLPPAAGGPRSASSFCLAPPVPLKKDRPPFREWAPPLRDHPLTPGPAPARFATPDTARVLFLFAAFSDVGFDTSAIDTSGLGRHDPDTLMVGYYRRLLRHVGEFYHDVSYGRLVFTWTLPETVFVMPHPMSYYGDDDAFAERGTKLIWDAVAAADPMIDFGGYTGLAIVHAGAGQETDISQNSEDQIWSANFPQPLISLVMTDSLGYDVPGIPTDDLLASGDTVYVEGAGLVPATESQDGYRFGLLGVWTHELGHVMAGWPDLYDTTPEDPSLGVGAFCLMSAGTWNGPLTPERGISSGWLPGEPCSWARWYAGWLDVVPIDSVPPEGLTVRLKHIERDHYDPATDTLAVRIPLSGDEYLLVACRKPDPNGDGEFDWSATADSTFSFWSDSYAGAELDFYTPNEIPASPTNLYREAGGLYIWHIDESVMRFGFDYNIVNSDPHHMGLDLEEADGLQDLEHDLISLLSFGSPDDPFRAGHRDTFAPWTNPSSATSFGAPSGVVIDRISGADTVMTFRVRFNVDAGTGAAVADGWPVNVPASAPQAQPLAADLDGDGGSEFVLVGREGEVTVLKEDGTPVPIDPCCLPGPPAGSPLAGDVDVAPSLLPELVAVSASGEIYTWSWNGGGLDGALADTVGFVGFIEGTLADVDAAPGLDLVIGSTDAGPDSTDGKLWVVRLNGDGTDPVRRSVPIALAGAPVVLPGADEASAFVVHAGAEGGMWLFGLGDAAAAGDALVNAGVRFGMPAVADLDGDGAGEIMAAGEDGQVYVWRVAPGATLELVPGWPAGIGSVPGSGVSGADVDGDGYSDVLSVGTGGRLCVLNYNGVALAGWPQKLDSPLDTFYDLSPPHPAPLAADVAGDEGLELIAVFGDGRIVGMAPASGARTLAGWPLQGTPGSVPIVGSFSGPDPLAAVQVFSVESPPSDDGRGFPEHLWSRAVLWELGGTYRPRDDEWRMHRRDAARSASAGSSRSDRPGGAPLLAQVWCQPNPAHAGGTRIHYRLGTDAERVDVHVYDLSGLEVRRFKGTADRGVDNLVHWDGTNDDRRPVAPGLYVFRVSAVARGRTDTAVGKVVLIR